MQIFTVTFLLCAATTLVYGNVDVITTEHSSVDNSVHDGESHFHGTFTPSGIPITEVPTTGAPLPTYSTTEEILTTGKVPTYGHASHPSQMPHEPSTTHRNTLHPFQYHPLQHHSHMAPYHPLWHNRHNGFGMHPYTGAYPMPPLVIVKLLQPIVMPIARNVHGESSPKAEIDIDMERITHNGHHSHHNRYGHKEGHHRFVQHFNHLGHGYNRFGQGFNRQFDSMEQDSLPMYGNGYNQFGHGMHHNRFGHGFNQFGHGMSHMGMNRFGNGFYRFAQEPNHFHQGFARSERSGFRHARYGKHGSPMEEDQDMHITVKLN